MHIADKSFTRAVFDPNGPVKIAVIYDRKEALHMRCYRSGGCGPYEMYSCNECPASKPNYLNKNSKTPINEERHAHWEAQYVCSLCGESVSTIKKECPSCHAKMDGLDI